MSESMSPGENILNEILKNKPLLNKDRFTYKEVAEEIIGMVTVDAIKQKIKRKELDRVKNGKDPFILRSQLIAYFDRKNSFKSEWHIDKETERVIHEYDNNQALYWNRYKDIINGSLKEHQRNIKKKLSVSDKKHFRSLNLIDWIEHEVHNPGWFENLPNYQA